MGYGCCLASGVVAYRSRTQSICAQSSTEAELIAANAVAKVTKYLRFILHELGYTQTEPTPIYEDNDSAIKIVNHNRPTDRSCHVEIRYFALQHWRLMKDKKRMSILLPSHYSPSWSRESWGHAHKSTRLGIPPSSCPLPHGALWQSLPVNCLGSTSSFYFHQDKVNEFY